MQYGYFKGNHRKYNIKTEIQREETGRRGEPMEKPVIRDI
jgi:hypothetical protein